MAYQPPKRIRIMAPAEEQAAIKENIADELLSKTELIPINKPGGSIHVYTPGSPEHERLRAAAAAITALTGCPTQVIDCWNDYGARMMWTTISCRPKGGTSWQALNGPEHAQITKGSDDDFLYALRTVIQSVKELYRPATRQATVVIPAKHYDMYNALMQDAAKAFEENQISPGETLESWTANFGSHIEGDLKVCSSDDDVWCELVLFDEGCEVACSEVMDSLDSEWKLEYNGIIYEVKIRKE